MAKGDDTSNNNMSSGVASQRPQQNQYLTGNPSTNNNANTNWMGSASTTRTPGNIVQAQPNPPSRVSNGTMLGSIGNTQRFTPPGSSFLDPNIMSRGLGGQQQQAGNVGQYMPQGYDQGKWNDPNKNSPKYVIGRILSKYPPNSQGLQAAAPELQSLGYRVDGKDGIIDPNGVRIDVGQAFSAAGTSGMGNWWWNPQGENSFNTPINQLPPYQTNGRLDFTPQDNLPDLSEIGDFVNLHQRGYGDIRPQNSYFNPISNQQNQNPYMDISSFLQPLNRQGGLY